MGIDPKDVGKAVRFSRLGRNLRQIDLAQATGLSEGTIKKLENDPEGVKLGSLLRVIGAMDMSMHDLAEMLAAQRGEPTMRRALDDLGQILTELKSRVDKAG